MNSTERLHAAISAAETLHPGWARICDIYGTEPNFARELITSGVSLPAAVWLLHEASVDPRGGMHEGKLMPDGIARIRGKLAARSAAA